MSTPEPSDQLTLARLAFVIEAAADTAPDEEISAVMHGWARRIRVADAAVAQSLDQLAAVAALADEFRPELGVTHAAEFRQNVLEAVSGEPAGPYTPHTGELPARAHVLIASEDHRAHGAEGYVIGLCEHGLWRVLLTDGVVVQAYRAELHVIPGRHEVYLHGDPEPPVSTGDQMTDRDGNVWERVDTGWVLLPRPDEQPVPLPWQHVTAYQPVRRVRPHCTGCTDRHTYSGDCRFELRTIADIVIEREGPSA